MGNIPEKKIEENRSISVMGRECAVEVARDMEFCNKLFQELD